MTSTLLRPSLHKGRPALPPMVGDMGLDEASPFGLQGLKRETLRVLKPDCIRRLAVTLALHGTPEQIGDESYVAGLLSQRPDWWDDYRVVHLIEKTLWISGHSDLVMTLIRNPSQIPDNPPPEIHKLLSRAYAVHPDATIWYGVPLFSKATNADGLPIPLTAEEVRAEARRRIAAAQQQALRWGWAYRTGFRVMMWPAVSYQSMRQRLIQIKEHCVSHYRQARADARRRTKAAIQAQMEQCRMGRSWTTPPEHSTSLGWTAAKILETLFLAQSVAGYVAPAMGTAAVPLAIAKIVPMFLIPLPIIVADPFLFVELPDEPGKLRHLGHWYWQDQPDGAKKLHVHA
jgi:hypothetical protein